MEVLREDFDNPKNVALILGFFDGVHLGHQNVIKNTPNIPKVLVTFSTSPAAYFNKDAKYIYSREYNYRLIEKLGIDYVYEQDFEKVVNLSASEYLEKLIKLFSPVSITTGFNHTFGANRLGNSIFLENNKKFFDYFCTPPTIIDNSIVSSTKIKEFLHYGQIEKANTFLTRNFSIISNVVEGAKIGRKLGFPTANLKYPNDIIKIPHGVYKVKILEKIAIMNWGIKPTFNCEEAMEVHIPNFNQDLYNQELEIEIVSKIRDEKKFDSLEELKTQIEKDIEICLK